MPDEHLHISTAGSVNPHATSVNDTYNIYETPRPSRMSVYLQKLHVDIESNATREINGELLEYKTKLDGTKGLEEKLTEGGFSRAQINEALRKKRNIRPESHQIRVLPVSTRNQPVAFCRH